jgi:hypothetical protein
MVMACVALLVSLGGVSYAAGVLPKNSVGTKQLRKAAVVPSKIAPSTISLFKGQKGAPGPTGDPGPKGDTGSKGDTGPAGPFPGALPSGATLRGAYSLYGYASFAGVPARDAISFGFALASAPTAHFVPLGEAGGANCPGTYVEPQAAPGQLCVYEDLPVNVSTVSVVLIRRYGAVLAADSSAGGSWGSIGSWAVTAP